MLLAFKHRFLSIFVKALESLYEVLLLVIWEALHDIDHEDAVATVTQTWARTERQAFVLGIVDDLRLSPTIDVVV